jgi:TRAP-type mannitol/chloroaromatic compound transport system permease small subunit
MHLLLLLLLHCAACNASTMWSQHYQVMWLLHALILFTIVQYAMQHSKQIDVTYQRLTDRREVAARILL